MSTPETPLTRPRPLAFADPNPFGRREVERGKQATLYAVALVVSFVVGLSLAVLPPLIYVAAIGALASAVFIFMQPFVGLLLYTLLFILRPGEIYPILGALHLERLIGALTLARVYLSMIREHGTIAVDTSTQSRALLFFTVAIVFSIPFSFWVGHSMSTFVDMLKIGALYLMIVHLVDTRKRVKIFIWTYLLMIVYLAGSSLISYYTAGGFTTMGVERAVGTTSAGGGANELGTTMATTLPFFILLFIGERARWGRAVTAMGGGVLVWTMVITGSRASLLGCLSGLIYLWWRSKRRVLLGSLGIGALLIAFSVMPEQYRDRYGTLTKSQLDGSSKGRIEAWLTGLEMFTDRPLFGVGAGCFGTARAAAYSGGGRKNWLESHSLYIQVISELGLIGASAFFFMLYQFLKLNRRVRRMLEPRGPDWKWERMFMMAVFTGLVVLVISAFFGHSLYRRTWYLYAALGLAMFRILAAENRKTEIAAS